MILDRIDQWFAAVERFGGSLARSKRLAVAICGLLVLLVRLVELPRMPVPVPRILDEFSYLLANDTFSSGRLTNPQHPLWTRFESIHILQSPTYMSMYPPAQGLFLALGQKLTGVPWTGVLLSVSLACAAMCWMLQGWLPPGWALFGGLLIAMRIGPFSYWMNTYYGGGVAMLGGALVFGALPRVMRRANLRDALLLALGLAIVANSRPYEGVIAAIPVAAALALWLFRGRGDARARWLGVAVPIVCVLAVTGVWMGYYNWRVTGDPFLFPQVLDRQTYAVAPYFMWESERPEPVYRHEILRRYYVTWEGRFQSSDEQVLLEGWLSSIGERFLNVWRIFLGGVLSVPLVLAPYALLDRRMRFWAWSAPVFLVGLGLARFTQAHYVAPMMGGIYVVSMQAMRHLRYREPGVRSTGLWIVRAVAVIAVGAFVHKFAIAETGMNYQWQFDRAQLQERLERMPGKQLVMVRYGAKHFLDQEWVYNRADIDRAKVVWAREMVNAADNADLQAYFHDRACWILEPDVDQSRLTPCSPLRTP